MSITDVNKARHPVWVPCPIKEYNDEKHLIMPATRENLQYVSDKSMVNEMQANGTFARESDTNIFTIEWMKRHWKDWKNVGIVHEAKKDMQGNILEPGRTEYPAAFTEKNWLIIANIRGQAFLLWLQEASRQLAAQAQQVQNEQRETFRQADQVSSGSAEPELHAVSDPV